jgi:hypothetical protein
MWKKKSHKLVVVGCALLILSPVLGVAQHEAATEPKNAISLNLGRMAWEFFYQKTHVVPLSFDYQRVLTDHFVLVVGSTLDMFPENGIFFDQVVGFDWHPFDLGLNGLFIGAFIDVASSTRHGDEWSAAGASAAVGYELTDSDFLQIEICIGGGGIGIDSAVDGLGLVRQFPSRFDLSLGFRF